MNDVDRLLSKTWRNPATGCWEWVAALRGVKGYGSFTLNGRSTQAHRASYTLLVGPIPDGAVLDHLCRNRKCVNPEHLEPVTDRENILRGDGVAAHNAQKTSCKNGHAFTPENTLTHKSGRGCRQCGRDRSRAYMARKRSSLSSTEVQENPGKQGARKQ